jgi:hypothetical protein
MSMRKVAVLVLVLGGTLAPGRRLAATGPAAPGEVWAFDGASAASSREDCYRVTVDRSLVQEAKLTASDGAAGDYFGGSVSISGDTVVVGADQGDTAGGVDAGSAYVFVRSGSAWSPQQKLVAADGTEYDHFGISVSVSGDTAVVGAFQDSPAGVSLAGSAYVFARAGEVWNEQQKLTASDAGPGDDFGSSVSISGGTVVVGAEQSDIQGGSGAGSAYVFVWSGTAWDEQQKLVAPDGAAADRFGYSLSVSGDTAVVGAFGDDTTAGADAGSAYVFVRSGTVWSQQQKLTGDGAPDGFGWSVSASGETVVVGAPGADTAGGSGAGAAYVFVRSGTVWSQQQKLTAGDGAASDGFGSSVSASGDTVVVGARGADPAGGSAAGAAYVFVRSGSAWSQRQKLTAGDGAAYDFFGSSVSASGGTAVIGASGDDTGGGANAGSAYVFRSDLIFKDGFEPVG